MNYHERKLLRIRLLKEIYDYYFENNGSSYKIKRDDYTKDTEVRLAYNYLSGKGYINIKNSGLDVEVSITVHGIDLVESTIE